VRFHTLLLTAILLLATALRVYSLGQLGFWTDELCSLSDADGWGLRLDRIPLDQPIPPLPVCTHLASARPIADVVRGVSREDAHPPLYFVLLRLWEDCFGDSESAVRSLGVVFSVAGVALLYFVARDTVGSAAALRACLLMAVAVPQIQFAQEARNYAPAVTLTILAVLCLVRLNRRPTIGSASAFAAALLLMMLTHYYAAGAAGALVLHGLITFRGRARRYTLAAAATAGVLFLALWGPSLFGQLHHLGDYSSWLKDTGPGRTGRLATNLFRLPVRYFTDTETFGLPVTAIAIFGAALALLLPVGYVRRPDLRLWITLAVCPVAMVAFADARGSTVELSWLRYTLMAAPAVYVLVAAAVPRGRWSFAPTAVAAMAALSSVQTAYVPSWKIDFSSPAALIARNYAGDALVISGPSPVQSSIAFAAFQHYLPAVPDPSMILTKPMPPALVNRLRGRHVFVVWQWQDRAVRDLIPGFVRDSVGGVPHLVTFYRGHVE
jgi:uncharacterized membrane protein